MGDYSSMAYDHMIPTHFDLPGLEVTHLRDRCVTTLWLMPILLYGLRPYYSMVTPILLYGYAHITLWLCPYHSMVMPI